MAVSNKYELGYYGNIWVRSHVLEKAGDTNDGGHVHYFDHVSMLHKGSVRVDVTNPETGEKRTKDFKAPTFIVIRKDHTHKITALEDDTQYYCVFALRDIDGEVVDIYSPENDPMWQGSIPSYTDVPLTSDGKNDDEYWLRKKKQEEMLKFMDEHTTQPSNEENNNTQ